MLKTESVCTFCWRAWCWSLDQDQTCCVLARLSCTGHPVKACDARTSPRPCGHEYNSTYALSFVVGVVPVLHAAFSELYHFWLAPRCVQRHKKHLGIFEKNVFGRCLLQLASARIVGVGWRCSCSDPGLMPRELSLHSRAPVHVSPILAAPKVCASIRRVTGIPHL